ncbi:hypothetical protein MC885_005705, partial [Smutsia gigantea]
DSVVPEDRGRQQGRLVPQEGLAGAGAGREQLLGQALQAPAVLRGHRVPRLGRPEVQVVDAVQVHVLRVPRERGLPHAEVQVVDAVQVHVLRVPRERGLPHAEVQIGRVDALDDQPALLLQQVLNGAQVSHVPLLRVRIKQGAADVSAVDRRTIEPGLPVLSLQILKIRVRWGLIFATVGQVAILPHRHGLPLLAGLSEHTRPARDHLLERSGD